MEEQVKQNWVMGTNQRTCS